MARPTSRQILEGLLKSRSPAVQRAFLEAITDLTNRVQLGEIIEALENGNVDAALDGLGIDEKSFEVVVEDVEQAYITGGRSTAAALPTLKSPNGGKVVFRFSARNPEAEAWLDKNSSDFITRTVETQRRDIRAALVRGLGRGDNPRKIALDIAGRVEKGSNRRVGGLLGLSGPQIKWVDNARGELGGLTARDVSNYMRRSRRDKRFDRTIAKAFREKKPLTQAEIELITGRYSDRLLKSRADAIGRTEALNALGASQYEAYRQAIASGNVDAEAVKKKWKHSLKPPPHRRETHVAIHNNEAAFFEPFTTPTGTQLLYPRDRSLGAGVEDIANCACAAEYRIDFAASLRPSGSTPSAPSASPAPQAKTFEVLEAEGRDYVLANGRAQGIEHLIAYDAETLEEFAPISGTKNSAKLTPEMIAASNDPKSNAIFHHNHPTSRSLSLADLKIGSRVGVKGVWAHGHDSSEYYVEVPNNFSVRNYNKISNSVRAQFQENVNSLSLSREDAGALFAHSVMLSLDSFDIIDYRHDLKGGMLDAFNRNQSLIEEMLGL